MKMKSALYNTFALEVLNNKKKGKTKTTNATNSIIFIIKGDFCISVCTTYLHTSAQTTKIVS